MRNRIGPLVALALYIVAYSIAPQPSVAHCPCLTICTCPDCPIERTERQGRWFVVETANFRICCDQSETPALQLARHSESWRNQLCAAWLGETSPGQWNPKCQVVLHSSQPSYFAEVGR